MKLHTKYAVMVSLLSTLMLASNVISANPSGLGPIAIRLDDAQQDLLDLACILDQATDSATPTLALLGRRLRSTNDLDELATTLRALRPELARQNSLGRPARLTPTQSRQLQGVQGETLRNSNNSSSFNLMTLSLAENTAADTSATFWVHAHVDNAEQNDRENIDGFKSRSRGLTIGLDYSLNNNTTLGLSLAKLTSDVDSNRFGYDDNESQEVAVSLNHNIGAHNISTTVTFTNNQTERLRDFVIPTDVGLRRFGLSADIDSTQVSAGLGWSTQVESISGWLAAPYAALSYGKTATKDYAERAPNGALALRVESADVEYLLGSIGVMLGYSRVLGDWLVSPALIVGYEHDFQADPTLTRSQFRNTNFAFTSTGYSVEENRLRGAVGLTMLNLNGFGVGVSFETNRKDDYDYNAAIITLQAQL